jgi:uncharacterized membrane protein
MLEFLSYIFFFVAASASPLQRRWLATNKNKDNKGQIHFAFQITFVISILGLFLPFFEKFYISWNIFFIIGLSLICGITWGLYFIFSYISQKYVDAGVSTIVSNIYTPISIILATIFLNERLNYFQIIWTFLLLWGILIVSKKHKIWKFKFDKYFILMLLSWIFLWILITTERALQKMTGFTAGTMLSWWSTCLFLWIATLFSWEKSQYTKKDILITGVLRFFQSLSWVILVFVVWNLSLVSSITTFKVVIVFILWAIFLHERDDLKRKVFWSIIAVIGLLLMK